MLAKLNEDRPTLVYFDGESIKQIYAPYHWDTVQVVVQVKEKTLFDNPTYVKKTILRAFPNLPKDKVLKEEPYEWNFNVPGKTDWTPAKTKN